MKEKELYIGIDFNDEWTQISYYRPGMEDVQTISLVLGEERYRIPTALCKRQEFGPWYLTDGQKEKGKQEIFLDSLWLRSLKNEVLTLPNNESYEVRELLLLFLRKIIRLVPEFTGFNQITAITIHLEEPTLEAVKLIQDSMLRLGVSRENIYIQDSKEAFCHFAMHQEKELMLHEMVLFLGDTDKIACFILEKKGRTQPTKISIKEMDLGYLPEGEEERDRYFAQKVTEVMKGRIVSSVYLMGESFEGGWMKESLNSLCRGRRAFQGKNLYTKGACYSSYLQKHKDKWDYIYFSDDKLANNIFLQVTNGDRTFFHDLAEAGSSCYEVNSQCEVLLEGDATIDIWLQAPEKKEAKIETLELTDFVKRPGKANRLRIEALSFGKGQIMIRVTDLGFGEWYLSSGKVWEYCING